MIDLQWPILQVIIPLFGAILTALCQPIIYARFITVVTALLSLITSTYGLMTMESVRRYYLGNWKAPIGIEYKLDYLNQPVMVYISCLLLFTLLCCRRSIITQLESYITSSRQHIIYTMILLVHTGLSGMVATGDLFNLYVFLEISSLASYALISQGENRQAAKGALDYLILGTIGASLILIGIGALFSATGTLNIDDMHARLGGLYHSRMVILGLCFFITGCMLKIALFPLHFWMVRAYRVASPAVLVFIAGLSSVVGFYVLLRFIYFVVDYRVLYNDFNFATIIRILGLIAVVINSYLAWKAQGIRELIVYSIAAQIGYICLMLIVPQPAMLGVLASCLLADSLLKIGLFSTTISSLRGSEIDKAGSLPCAPLPAMTRSNKQRLFLFLLFFNLLSSAGMPLTIGFVNKINIISLLFSAKEYTAIIVIIAASVLALEYNYRLFRMIYSSKIFISRSDIIAISVSTIASLALLILNSQFTSFVSRFFAEVIGV